MNKLISIFVFTIGVALVCSCTDHFPEKVERYISKHNILNDQGKGELDLREVLDIDYDTMYVFYSLTPHKWNSKYNRNKNIWRCRRPLYGSYWVGF